jgi:hypothetical protein
MQLKNLCGKAFYEAKKEMEKKICPKTQTT